MSQFALQLYDTYFDQVYNYVYFRVRNIQLAEDITSEIFLKVVRFEHTFRTQAGASERSWLFAIVRNTITDHYRSKRETENIDEVEVLDHASLQEDVHAKLLYQEALQAIDQLPERQQDIVSLRYLSGLQNKEIAELLNIDERTVSGTLSKGLNHLRQALALHL